MALWKTLYEHDLISPYNILIGRVVSSILWEKTDAQNGCMILFMAIRTIASMVRI